MITDTEPMNPRSQSVTFMIIRGIVWNPTFPVRRSLLPIPSQLSAALTISREYKRNAMPRVVFGRYELQRSFCKMVTSQHLLPILTHCDNTAACFSAQEYH